MRRDQRGRLVMKDEVSDADYDELDEVNDVREADK